MNKQKILDPGVIQKSRRLKDRRIAVGVCGGIGAVEVVRMIREMRRHGANISVFITPSVRRFVGSLSLEWAAQTPVVTRATRDVEYLQDFDLVLIAPLTLNTLSKSALGITDNPVTLLIASQISRKRPLIFVPAMNEDLLNHPLFKVYRSQLEAWGGTFLFSPIEESRLKMPTPETVTEAITQVLASAAKPSHRQSKDDGIVSPSARKDTISNA